MLTQDQFQSDPASAALADARLAAIVDSSFDAIISKDLDSIVTSWNRAAGEIFGYSAEEAIGRSILFLIPEDRHSEEVEIIARIRRGEHVPTYETMRRHKDGRLLAVSLTVSPILDASGRIVGASKIARDVTAAKENERRIALLLREVHHRVKNNLQMVSSLIQLQAMPEDIKLQLRGRVMAIAAVHEHLHHHESFGAVDVARYLRDLFGSANEAAGGYVTLDVELEPMHVAPDCATTLGLIVNELVTNTNKYAYPHGNYGTLRARLWRSDPACAVIRLTNDGVPFDADAKANGIGIRLIRSLAASLASDYEFDGSNGLHFQIRFATAS